MKTKSVEEYEDDMDFGNLFTKRSRVLTRSIKQTEYLYPLDYTIETFEQSEDLFRLLSTANSGDLVKIYICTNGGNLAVAERIVDSIAEARERGVIVIGQLGFNVASAGTYIALNCTDLIISPNLQFCVHNWSTGVGYGHAANILTDAEFNKKMATRWVISTYENFLSEEELASILENPRDLNFDADEVIDRWEKMKLLQEDGFDDEVKQFNLKDLIKETLLEIEAEKLEVIETPKVPVKRVRVKKAE